MRFVTWRPATNRIDHCKSRSSRRTGKNLTNVCDVIGLRAQA
jgi:hypothetical protein